MLEEEEQVQQAQESQHIVSEKKSDKPEFVMFNNMKYIPLPISTLKEMRQGGILREQHEKTVLSTYNAMLKHKEYYDNIMKQWNYNVPDSIPSIDVIRDILYTFETYLFGWFALRMEPSFNYVLEDSVRLMGEYISDIKAGKVPRCLRDL